MIGRRDGTLGSGPRGRLLLAAILFAASFLPFLRLAPVTDVASIVGTPSAETLAEIQRVFGYDERAYVLLEAASEGRDPELLRLARRLAEELAEAEEVESVEYQLPLSPGEFVDRIALPYGVLYDDPAELDRRLSRAGMAEHLEAQASRLALPGLGEADEYASRDPLEVSAPVVRRLASFRGGWRFRPGAPQYLSQDGRALLVVVEGRERASDPTAARRVVEEIDGAIARATASGAFPGVSARATGGYHLAEESERIVRTDVVSGVAGSILLSALLLAFALRLDARSVLLLSVPTIWGTQVGLGAFAAVVPRPTALAFACSGLLVGLGIDFTIHVTTESLARAASGASPAVAVAGAFRETRARLVIAAATTLAAFLSFLCSSQAFLREMGLVVTLGVLACLGGAFLVLPPILVRVLERRSGHGAARELGGGALGGWAMRHPRTVLAAAGAVSLAAAAALALVPPGFETDLRRLHARDSEPLAVQERIAELYGGSAEPVLVLFEGPDEAAAVDACRRFVRAIASEPGIASTDSIVPLFPDPREEAGCLAVLARRDPSRVRADLGEALDQAGFDPAAFAEALDGLDRAVRRRDPLGPEDLRRAGLASLVDRFVRTEGGKAFALVVLYPRADLWTGEAREAVTSALAGAQGGTEVAGRASSLHLVAAESAGRVASDLAGVSLLTALGILAVLALRFRRPGLVAAAILPASLATLWTAALHSVLGMGLNLMNMAVLPMILGIGVDDGIHLMDVSLGRSLAEFRRALRATGAAIVLTSLTTMVAFGGFALSRNRGLSSVGVLAVAGIGSALIASLLVVPAVLALRGERPCPSASEDGRIE